jgi:hypothetical protein
VRDGAPVRGRVVWHDTLRLPLAHRHRNQGRWDTRICAPGLSACTL